MPQASSRVTRSMSTFMGNAGPGTSSSATSRREPARGTKRMRAPSTSSSGSEDSSDSWGIEPKESGSYEHKRNYWHARYRDGLDVRECKEFVHIEKKNENWKLFKIRKSDDWANAHALTKLEPLASNKELLAKAQYAIKQERLLENPGYGWSWVPLARFMHLAKKYKVHNHDAILRMVSYFDRTSPDWNVPMKGADKGKKKEKTVAPACGYCSESLEAGFQAFQDHLDDCNEAQFPPVVAEAWVCSCGLTFYDQQDHDDHINDSVPPAAHKIQNYYSVS
ncbi:uncharacterized protein J3D65DRAFT_305888 [Phyllosticta citribraziliensis]|uniref:C2H2-type domain-containing protein n=1 Tax=Phyllosticta citribraziliensis TaxID=989973 RepID=A0ABR1LXY3_9PEZI